MNMKQAKTLNERELKAVFVQIGTRRFAARDRAIVAVSYYAGLRAHEIAALTISDVLASDGSIRNELVLLASQTKGKESRKIFPCLDSVKLGSLWKVSKVSIMWFAI